MMRAADFFSLPASLEEFRRFFEAEVAPWTWLDHLEAALAAVDVRFGRVGLPPGVHVEGEVFIHPTVKLPPYATILGPAWIGAHTEIRPGAFVRGPVIVGEHGVLGQACEFKHCLLLDRVQVPHFSYVGDSVLGNGAHLGAGAICSNLRLDQQPVVVRGPEQNYDSGRKKLGAIVGDEAEVGCNAVLNPGTVLGRRGLVMPAVVFSGYLPPTSIAKNRQGVTVLPRRD